MVCDGVATAIQDGCFQFDIVLPPTYPQVPPQVQLITTGKHYYTTKTELRGATRLFVIIERNVIDAQWRFVYTQHV
jgi:ubiquitin-protein ligase